ncbi:hypothetical protein [Lactococcus lactis]|uniref:hypothetical protein n=1 Tax=Lactococcus lactis TaxID=1358 RepID=UPI001179E4AE|nr:hypothetical protein [Lactococcus lactis]MBR8673593.1 hypothetical protein [Lactococcus lactis subsp. lactis]MBR8676504.1 hypothetical protein [Lactococcus lactis subsp. lactis]MBR8683989.1 hypothetical protein [Lactococcus lactis subsp. lactis]MCH5427455.1 hypothetical protein [Lactococcus lactis]MCT0078786.1 hypothetical protein [Lactococcus lactis subsp. lactis]
MSITPKAETVISKLSTPQKQIPLEKTANISFDNFDFVANSEDKYNSTLEIIAEFLNDGLDESCLELDDTKALEKVVMSVMLVLKLIENHLKITSK